MEFAAEAAHAALDAFGANAQGFELGKFVSATEREAGAIVFDVDVEDFALLGEGNGDAAGLGVFLDVVEGLADDLQDFEEAFGFAGDFLAGVAGGNAGIFLEVFDEAADGGGEAFAFHFKGPHAADKGAEFGDLGAADHLEVLEFLETGADVAAEHLLDDVEAELEADEALEGAIVEVVGDAFALGLAEAFGFGAQQGRFALLFFEAVGDDTLFERERAGEDAGEHDEGLEDVELRGLEHEEEALAEDEHGEDLAPGVEDGGFEQKVDVEEGVEPDGLVARVVGEEEEDEGIDGEAEQWGPLALDFAPEQGDEAVDGEAGGKEHDGPGEWPGGGTAEGEEGEGEESADDGEALPPERRKVFGFAGVHCLAPVEEEGVAAAFRVFDDDGLFGVPILKFEVVTDDTSAAFELLVKDGGEFGVGDGEQVDGEKVGFGVVLGEEVAFDDRGERVELLLFDALTALGDEGGVEFNADRAGAEFLGGREDDAAIAGAEVVDGFAALELTETEHAVDDFRRSRVIGSGAFGWFVLSRAEQGE